MEIWQAIALGAVQGFTEFLPVSSSGHLILAERWLNVNVNGGLFFDITLHLGTLVPVIIMFFGEIKSLFKKPFKNLAYLLAASLPAAIVGVFAQDGIEILFKGTGILPSFLLAGTFTLTAFELLLTQKIYGKNKNALPLSFKSSIIMGVFQSFAVLPGLSRSGTVITGGAVAKLDRNTNAEFAFLMSIPVILGAAASSCLKAVKVSVDIQTVPVVFGVITAAITGYISIGVMIKAVKKSNFIGFSVYLLLLAAASVLTAL